MIDIQTKETCCGCGACMQRCPVKCISMHEDEEGFLYPLVDKTLCIDCGLCEKVCPIINQNKTRQPLEVYSAVNPNDNIRLQSSSGGIFSLLAEKMIDKGGVVFGASFNEHWEVVHSYAECKEGLMPFRKSKYVQSDVGNTFVQAEQFLRLGRNVLFSGTPCQIAGLKRYLRREYDNLLTLDFICHGTPSPGVFRWYMSEELKMFSRGLSFKQKLWKYKSLAEIPSVGHLADSYGLKINRIDFRDKRTGWKNYSFSVNFSYKDDVETRQRELTSSLYENSFLIGFLNDLYLRPCCHSCPFKKQKSGSDVTIGDFWGIGNYLSSLDETKGVSVVMANNAKGSKWIKECISDAHAFDYESVSKYNQALVGSPQVPSPRNKFFNKCGCSFSLNVLKYSHLRLSTKFKKLQSVFTDYFLLLFRK